MSYKTNKTCGQYYMSDTWINTAKFTHKTNAADL